MTPNKEQFQILDARSHCRKRPGMYVGSTAQETYEQFLLGKWQKITYIPAIFKMINEVIDNSIDEFVRSDGKFATKIDVSIDSLSATVTDNGRGIPQDMVQTPEGEMISRPVAAWTKNNAGTSFGDNRTTIGAHGLGAALVNYMSESFLGKTWQNGKLIEVHCSNGAENIEVKEKSKSGNGTSVTFTPDFSFFEVKSLNELDTVALIEDRLIGLQMAFPEITFSFNGKKIQVRDIKRYAELFAEEGASVILEKNENLSFFFTSSNDGFRSNSFVNGVNTRLGGTYVDHIVNNVVDELLVLIKKKHKIEVAKSVVKNGITFIAFARNFVNPKYDSQTKERLTNSVGEVRTHYEENVSKDFKYLAKKIFGASDIIEPIIAAQIAKKNADDKRNVIVAQKKLKKVKVAKHIAASSEDALLALVEGDSAMGFLLKVRDSAKLGAYPLRGVIMNTWNMKPADVLKNKELSELVAILGLDINDANSVDNMTYRGVATLTDADHDGAGHITPLLIAFFYKFWPRLLSEKRIHITRSPIMISTNGKDVKWFFTYEEGTAFKSTCKGYAHRYIKGLGSLQESEYDRVINDPVLDTVTVDDANYFQIMFGGDAQMRKELMMDNY